MMSDLHPVITFKPFLVGKDDWAEAKSLDANKRRQSTEPWIVRIQNRAKTTDYQFGPPLSSLTMLSNSGFTQLRSRSL